MGGIVLPIPPIKNRTLRQTQECARGCTQTGYIVPARTRVLGRRSSIVIECAQSIRGAVCGVNTVTEVPSRDRSFDRPNIIERTGMGVEEWISKAVWCSGFLIEQRHQTSKYRTGEARSADAVLIVVRPIGESLRLANQQARLRIAKRRHLLDRPEGEQVAILLLTVVLIDIWSERG